MMDEQLLQMAQAKALKDQIRKAALMKQLQSLSRVPANKAIDEAYAEPVETPETASLPEPGERMDMIEMPLDGYEVSRNPASISRDPATEMTLIGKDGKEKDITYNQGGGFNPKSLAEFQKLYPKQGVPAEQTPTPKLPPRPASVQSPANMISPEQKLSLLQKLASLPGDVQTPQITDRMGMQQEMKRQLGNVPQEAISPEDAALLKKLQLMRELR